MKKVSSESFVKDIRRKTRKKYSSEEKIRIVLEGLRGEDSIAGLCRREGIPANLSDEQLSEATQNGLFAVEEKLTDTSALDNSFT
jgi:transposase-like protein